MNAEALSLLSFALFCFLKMSKHSSVSRTDDMYVCSGMLVSAHKNEDVLHQYSISAAKVC